MFNYLNTYIFAHGNHTLSTRKILALREKVWKTKETQAFLCISTPTIKKPYQIQEYTVHSFIMRSCISEWKYHSISNCARHKWLLIMSALTQRSIDVFRISQGKLLIHEMIKHTIQRCQALCSVCVNNIDIRSTGDEVPAVLRNLSWAVDFGVRETWCAGVKSPYGVLQLCKPTTLPSVWHRQSHDVIASEVTAVTEQNDRELRAVNQEWTQVRGHAQCSSPAASLQYFSRPAKSNSSRLVGFYSTSDVTHPRFPTKKDNVPFLCPRWKNICTQDLVEIWLPWNSGEKRASH